MLAILYVEIAEGFPAAAEQVTHVSLGNCKQLVSDFGTNELVVRLECDDPASLNQAISGDFAAIEGVKRITTCLVINT
jgi:hypothetical protein